MKNETKIKTIEEKQKSFYLFIKIAYLTIAIIFMGLAQSILSYTHSIGMAPVDSITTGIAYTLGLEYSQWNFIAVTLLVGAAILFAKKEDRLLTSTAFITGYFLAFVVQFLIRHVVGYFPGLWHDESGYGFNKIWVGIIWFFVGYTFLVLSVGLWINVGFGLRPYDILLIRLSEKYEKYSYVFFRNVLDTSFVIAALIFTSLSLATNTHNPDNLSNGKLWLSRNSVFFGSLVFIFFTGYVTNFLKNLFAKPFN